MRDQRRVANFERVETLAAFRAWFTGCGQSLGIVGAAQSGKTFLARQLAELPECVAAHFCRCNEPQTSESATFIQSIGEQLSRRFPNLVLPRLSTTTFLAEPRVAIEHYLQMPLDAMPIPSKPVFIVLDNMMNNELLEMLRTILPRWIRLVWTSRKVDYKDVHILRIDLIDLERFIKVRLPHCSFADILKSSQGSWLYVDLLSRAIDFNILFNIPKSITDLLADVVSNLPKSFTDVLKLVKASRNSPTRQQLLAVAQMLVHEEVSILEVELNLIHDVVCDEEPSKFEIPFAWLELIDDLNLARYHSAWAEHFKTKRKKTAQDIIELAYHLAHSDVPSTNAVKTLQSIGASQLLLKCSVIDVLTTKLLTLAGAKYQDHVNDVVFACSTGNIDELKAMIGEARPSSAEICMGLLIASARGNLAMCRFIVDAFPHVAISSCCGEWNALRSAACNGQLGVLELLLSKGVHVDECGNSDRTALRAAAWAGQLAAVQLLLQAGADVDRRDSENRTALMAAAFMDHKPVVQVILQYGADINAVDKSGATAFHLNLSNGSKGPQHQETTQLLLEHGALCTIEDGNGRVVLHLAAYHGDASLPEILKQSTSVDVQDSMGQTPLILAASQGQLESVRLLVESNADVDCIDHNGRTALQWAAINGHTDTVRYLCGVGSDELHKDNDGAISLHYAVAHDNVDLVRILINEQTINAADRYGQHPLIVACGHGNVNVIRELLANGAPRNLAAHDGRTPLTVAALAGHTEIIELLAPGICDWNQLDQDGTPLVHTLIVSKLIYTAEILLKSGASPTAKDAHGRTCAHVVASTNDLNAAAMLRTLGASFEVTDAAGRTPLMTAVWAKHYQIVFYLLETCGVEPNRVDHQGASALSIAAQIGDRDLVTLLLKFGADATIRDSMARTPIDVARLSGHESIAALLKAANGSSDSSGIGSSVPNSPLDGGGKSRCRRATQSLRARILNT
ncbi:unnamed protein product [Caenorhabditis bovis]|uniref:Nephrocystin 3-like N-terminal domain-containing protein n=1 Tax=Caenorhabditis bovis TaxID=2654633 RepID=A0A8S1EPZ7_9PELO|nr:unnamed protein product [Caenorhabditis bovis]